MGGLEIDRENKTRRQMYEFICVEVYKNMPKVCT